MSISEVDRSIVVVRPRQPYLDWADSLPDPTPVTLAELREQANAYLVPEIFDPGDELAILERYHAPIFEHELAGWIMVRELWPARRDLDTFTEWFDVEFHGMVFDLCGSAISRLDAGDG